MNHCILSILTPGIPTRLLDIAQLCEHLGPQCAGQPVEHLVLIDNCARSVGAKRDALLRAARGRYVAYVDDDDTVSAGYVAHILEAAKQKPDVITFRQHCTVNDLKFEVEFRLGNPNEAPHAGVVKRNAWHVCAWRRSLALQSSFPESNYGEDWEFAGPLCAIPGLHEVHIPEVLHFYRHSSATTAAPPP